MSGQLNRYAELLHVLRKTLTEPKAAPGWMLSRLTPPSGLFGANGMQFGPGGRLYVAQAFGSQITAINITTGDAETISPLGGPIVAPDDVAFDSHGTLYVSETGKGRVVQVHRDGSVSPFFDGLAQPKGLALQDKNLLVLDHGTKELHAIELATNKQQVLASQLPVGEPNGLSRSPMDFLGGIATRIDGTIYIAADAEGSVLTLHKA